MLLWFSAAPFGGLLKERVFSLHIVRVRAIHLRNGVASLYLGVMHSASGLVGVGTWQLSVLEFHGTRPALRFRTGSSGVRHSAVTAFFSLGGEGGTIGMARPTFFALSQCLVVVLWLTAPFTGVKPEATRIAAV